MVTLSALTSRFRRPLRTHPWRWLLGGWASSLILLWLWKLLTQTHISWLDAWQWTQLWLWLLLVGMALFFYCRRPQLPPQSRSSSAESPTATLDWLTALGRQPEQQQKPWYLLLNPMALDSEAWLQQLDADSAYPTSLGKVQFHKAHSGSAQWQAWLGAEATLLEPRAQDWALDESSDDDAWPQLYAALRQCRPRRPLHGILLLLDPAWLLSPEQHASRETRLLAARLQEIAEQLQIHPQLYCYITGLEALEGFTLWSNALPPDSQQQLIGVQFSQHSHHWQDELQGFWQHWREQLAHSLPSLLLSHDQPYRRSSLFRLQQQLAELQLASGRWLQQLLQSQSQIRLRGFFLGSHGEPLPAPEPFAQWCNGIPTLTHTINDHYRLQSASGVPLPHDKPRPGFIARYWQDIVLPEATLCSPALSYARHHRMQRRVLLSVMLLGSLAMLGGWHYFYQVNQARLQQWLTRLTPTLPMDLSTHPTPNNDLARQVLILDNLLDAQLGQAVPPSTPLLDRVKEMGLYQGGVLQQGMQNRYLAQLEHQLLPRLMRILVQQMDLSASQEKLQWLTLIRLLDAPPSNRPEWLTRYLHQQMATLFDTGHPAHGILDKLGQQRLIRHVQMALQYTRWADKRTAGDPLARTDYTPSARAVYLAQTELQAIPASQRLYQQLTAMAAAELPEPVDLRQLLWPHADPEHEFANALGTDVPRTDMMSADAPSANGNHSEKAGLELPVVSTQDAALQLPRLFTIQGWQYVVNQQPRLLQQAALDLWVLDQGAQTQGPFTALDPGYQQQLWQQLRESYRLDAEARWRIALDSVAVPAAHTKEQVLQQLALFTHPEQPLSQLLQRLTQEMTYPAPLQPVASNVTPTAPPESLISPEHLPPPPAVPTWQSLLAFGQPQEQRPSRLTELEQELRNLERYLQPLLNADDQRASALAALQTGATPSVLTQFQQQAVSLPAPLDHWFTAWAQQAEHLLHQEALQALEQQWQSQVLAEYEQRLANRYPFATTDSADVALADMEHFFAPQGTFDHFYQQQLAPWLARTGYEPLPSHQQLTATKTGESTDPYTELLASVVQVEQIRRLLFNPEGQLEMNFWLQPLQLSANKRRSILDLEGQLLDYNHDAGLRTHLIWPNDPEGTGISKLTLIPTERQRSPRSIRAQGPWALFRLLEQAQEASPSDAGGSTGTGMDEMVITGSDAENSSSRELTFTVDGGQMRYRLSTEAAPLDMTLFRHFRLPETLGPQP